MSKILLVDDEQRIREMLAEFLTRMDFDVIQATGGDAAIEMIKSGFEFDLMIIDMKMPKVTGLEVLQHKKRMKDLKPIIILTGFIEYEKEYKTELEELGLKPQDVIHKPIDLFLLLDEVKKRLNQKD